MSPGAWSERSPYGVAAYLEYRPDREYDWQNPTTVWLYGRPATTQHNHLGRVLAMLALEDEWR